MDYKGKWALVTGASVGLGACFAKELAKKGSNLILVARRGEPLETLATSLSQQFNIQSTVIALDLSLPEAAVQLFTQIQARGYAIRILINNAGFGVYGRFDRTELRQNQQEVILNVYSLMTLTQLCLPAMLEAREGVIINVASTAAFQPLPYLSVYGATKAFVLSFTEALWAEYQASDLGILALCPGPVETEFFKRMGKELKNLGEKDKPETIVKAAFSALETNKMVVIPGQLKNFLLMQASRFAPRKLVAKISEQLMR
jgi:short-subunit dehydrogenase